MSFTTLGDSAYEVHAGARLALVGRLGPDSAEAILPRPRTALIVGEPADPLLSFRTVGEQVAAAVGGTSRAARDRAIDLLELAGVAEPHRRTHDRPHSLGAIDRQRCQLALALARGPELLVCVDPAAGLTPDDALAFGAAIDHTQRALGHALLVGTTSLEFAQRLVNEILVLDDGGRVAQRMRRG